MRFENWGYLKEQTEEFNENCISKISKCLTITFETIDWQQNNRFYFQ